MAAGYLVNIFLGRSLGPVAYGTYGVIISLMTAVNLMQTAGLPQAVAKYIAEDENKADEVLKSGLLIQIVATVLLTVLFFILAKPLALLLHDVKLVPYIQLASLILPLYGIFALYTGYYNGLHNFKRQSVLNILYALLKVIAVLVLVSLFQLIGAIVGFIISPIAAIMTGIKIPKKVRQSFPYKKIILFSLPLIGFAIFSNLLQSIDLFFVKALMHSNKATGFYTANQNIAEIPFYAVTALAGVVFPGISRSVSQKLKEHTKKLILMSLRSALLILLPSILLISATSFYLLTFLFSSSYQLGATALSILVIGNGFFTLFTIMAMIISGSGFPLTSSILSGIGVIISSLVCIWLIPLFGLLGAAMATTIASFLVMLGAAVIVYLNFGVLLSVQSFLKILVASLIIYLLAKIIILPVILLPFLYIFLFGIYILLLILLKEITRDDVALLYSLLPQWIMKKRKI